jgi:hypothetical protein
VQERTYEIKAIARFFAERYEEQIANLTLSMVAVGEEMRGGLAKVRWHFKPQPDDGVVTLARTMVERIMASIRAAEFEREGDEKNPVVTYWRRLKAWGKEQLSSPFNYDDFEYLTLQMRCLRAVITRKEDRHTRIESTIPHWEAGGVLCKAGWKVLKEGTVVMAAGKLEDAKFVFYVQPNPRDAMQTREDTHRRYGFVFVSSPAELKWLNEQAEEKGRFVVSANEHLRRPKAAVGGLLW